MKQKNPYRMLGIVFASIAAAELVVVVLLLLCRPEAFETIALPFAGQCPIFGGIGVGFLIYAQRRKAKRERLLSNGYSETAVIVDIKENPFIRINRHHPWHVICHINRDGVVHEYRSEGLYHHPDVNIGDSVPVYLDRQNEKNYYVDVDSIMLESIRR